MDAPARICGQAHCHAASPRSICCKFRSFVHDHLSVCQTPALSLLIRVVVGRRAVLRGSAAGRRPIATKSSLHSRSKKATAKLSRPSQDNPFIKSLRYTRATISFIDLYPSNSARSARWVVSISIDQFGRKISKSAYPQRCRKDGT